MDDHQVNISSDRLGPLLETKLLTDEPFDPIYNFKFPVWKTIHLSCAHAYKLKFEGGRKTC